MQALLAEVATAREALTRQDAARDEALQGVRPVIVAARRAIHALHRNDLEGALAAYAEALAGTVDLRSAAAGCPGLWESGALEPALQEVAEAWSLLHLSGAAAAAPIDEITPAALLLGVADAIGELRRAALDALIAGDHAVARERLDQMERLTDALAEVDVARKVVDIKRRVDVARQLVDRTRGAVAMGRIEERMTTGGITHG